MPRVSLAFFTVAPIYGLAGMIWGAIMGASNDHGMMPAHAHLNRLGMVMMAVMGTFYALARDQVSAKLAWANFVLSNVAVLIMIPTLAKILQVGDANAGKLIPIIATSEVIAILGLLCFFVAILSCWRAKPSVQA
jgi:sorbitol-specific phosphotransferase system component IIBC